MTTSGWLHLVSCLYLTFVVTFILGILEFDEWRPIWRSTLRRSLKLIGALVIIGVVVQLLSFA
jgi:hypothetical protein